MKSAIDEVRAGLLQGQFLNEAAVSQGIVLRLLAELGWNPFNPEVVSPEYSTGGRRVDFALCHPPRKPIIFVEVKQVGQGSDAERQLFEYAFHQGVQMAVLTTGQEWHFFLPAERGSYEERRVYKLDLLERDVDESASRLTRYLAYKDVVSGKAIESARQEYGSIAREREVRRNLPLAWQKLLDDQDEFLVELIAEKTESLCGFRPDLEAVSEFLHGVSGKAPGLRPTDKFLTKPSLPDRPGLRDQSRATLATIKESESSSANKIRFELFGKPQEARTYRQLMITVFRALQARDSQFYERFAGRMLRNKRRPVLSRTLDELFPKAPHLAMVSNNWVQLDSEWYLDLNQSAQSILRNLRTACEIAGLVFGRDLKVWDQDRT